jgi:hypothetical protein
MTTTLMSFSIIVFALPAFSQSNIELEGDSSKTEINEFDDNKMTFKDSTKDYSVLRKKLNNFYKNSNTVKVIPLPPATASNSKVELLPLYRPGNRNIRFLKNQRGK